MPLTYSPNQGDFGCWTRNPYKTDMTIMTGKSAKTSVPVFYTRSVSADRFGFSFKIFNTDQPLITKQSLIAAPIRLYRFLILNHYPF